MLHILFLIFKIIGIVLLILLGLLLLLLLTVLLVPIRYRIAAVHGENLQIVGRVSWLLHIIHLSFRQENDKRRIVLRIFGFVFYDNLKPKRLKKQVTKASVKKTSVKKEKGKASEEKTSTVTVKESEAGKQTETIISQRTEASGVIHEDKLSVKTENDGNNLIEYNSGKAEDDGSGSRRISLFQRIIDRIKNIFKAIVGFISKTKDRIKHLILKLSELKSKARLISDFIKDEANKEAFKLSFESIKKLFKHIRPRKLKSKIIFGTGDPCSTGQALGAFSILYSFYGDNIEITPDFENKVFEGRHFAKGRIRLVTILIIVIKLIFDKRFKQLNSNFKILKEAL